MKNFVTKTAESAVKQDKNGNSYKTVTFSTLGKMVENHPVFGEMIIDIPKKSTSINLYEESYLNGNEEFGYSTAIGGYLGGDVITKQVAPYTFIDKSTGEEVERNTYSTVVFGDTESASWNSAIIQAFKSKGHTFEAVKAELPVIDVKEGEVITKEAVVTE